MNVINLFVLKKGMRFVANLRAQSIEAFTALDYKPDGWLLSVHRLNNRSLNYAHYVRRKRVRLFADNGSKAIIDEVIKENKESAKKIQDNIKKVETRINRRANFEDLPENIVSTANDLASSVVDKCVDKSDSLDSTLILEQQLSMNPTHIIAQEDFAVACLIALNLDRQVTGNSVNDFEKRNKRSLKLWSKVMKEPRCKKRRVYAVLGAVDYDTAYSAGRIAARKGVENIAVGMVGILLDLSTVTSFNIRGKEVNLDNPVRRRYPRFMQILAGLSDGYRSLKKSIKGFHALGLGTPTMFPILVGLMHDVNYTSTDSTSPIHAVVKQNTLFDPTRNGDRMSLSRIVTRILSGAEWECEGPFCSSFMNMMRHNTDAARRWWESHGRPKIEDSHLEFGEPIANALPLFSNAFDSPFLDNTRIAHNHWAMSKLTGNVPRIKRRRKGWALKKIDEMLTYESEMTARGLRIAKKILLKKRK